MKLFFGYYYEFTTVYRTCVYAHIPEGRHYTIVCESKNIRPFIFSIVAILLWLGNITQYILDEDRVVGRYFIIDGFLLNVLVYCDLKKMSNANTIQCVSFLFFRATQNNSVSLDLQFGLHRNTHFQGYISHVIV